MAKLRTWLPWLLLVAAALILPAILPPFRLNLLGRRTEASEIASAALFLAEGWLASGETLFIDSGQHLLAQPRDVLYLARE